MSNRRYLMQFGMIVDMIQVLLEEEMLINYYQDWARALQDTKPNEFLQQHHSRVSWIPPVQSRLKSNVDAAFFNEMNYTGYGSCVIDNLGQVIVSRTCLPVMEGEAFGLSLAVKFAISLLGLQNVDFETDNKEVADKRLLSLNPTYAVGFLRRHSMELLMLWLRHLHHSLVFKFSIKLPISLLI